MISSAGRMERRWIRTHCWWVCQQHIRRGSKHGRTLENENVYLWPARPSWVDAWYNPNWQTQGANSTAVFAAALPRMAKKRDQHRRPSTSKRTKEIHTVPWGKMKSSFAVKGMELERALWVAKCRFFMFSLLHRSWNVYTQPNGRRSVEG